MMLDLLGRFYGARAHHTYRKRKTNVEAEAVPCPLSRILLILKAVVRGKELGQKISLPKNGRIRLQLTFFVSLH
jgi:hypothetical protein